MLTVFLNLYSMTKNFSEQKLLVDLAVACFAEKHHKRPCVETQGLTAICEKNAYRFVPPDMNTQFIRAL